MIDPPVGGLSVVDLGVILGRPYVLSTLWTARILSASSTSAAARTARFSAALIHA
ncbi:hypothetical protein RQN9TF_31755 (plasmid) [Rhodococcus qingshengii]|nr:hypothetical protein RQN9TF_31755 [Rhodococcus qingshengii]